jgi:murein DD-endopeptidase MepM/ murein hydrolase activator NlpD
MKLRWSAVGTLGIAAVLGGLWPDTGTTPLSGPELVATIAPLETVPVQELAAPSVRPPLATRNDRPVAPTMPAPPFADTAAFDLQPPLRPAWETTIAAGDTLDGLLRQAGLEAGLRAELALAIATQFDLVNLRPGHRLIVRKQANGRLASATLEIDDGVRIVAVLESTPPAQRVLPETETAERAASVTIEGSIFASLERAGVPSRFAVDLAQMLGGTVDFRRDLKGGETLRLLWRERMLAGRRRIGAPELIFAALEMPGALFEIVWTGKEGGDATVFMDSEILRTYVPPVTGARLTSVFGMRRHPVYGTVRMHTGVDFAAAAGTPIRATAPGRIDFVGRRNGYGRVVEIAHGSDTMTRYSHMSGYTEGLGPGDRVSAGDVIGFVGSSGLATGPNLHYEVRVDGRPVDPLETDRVADANEAPKSDTSEQFLATARSRLAVLIADDSARAPRTVQSTKGENL